MVLFFKNQIKENVIAKVEMWPKNKYSPTIKKKSKSKKSLKYWVIAKLISTSLYPNHIFTLNRLVYCNGFYLMILKLAAFYKF